MHTDPGPPVTRFPAEDFLWVVLLALITAAGFLALLLPSVVRAAIHTPALWIVVVLLVLPLVAATHNMLGRTYEMSPRRLTERQWGRVTRSLALDRITRIAVEVSREADVGTTRRFVLIGPDDAGQEITMVVRPSVRSRPTLLAHHLQEVVAERPWLLEEGSRDHFRVLVREVLTPRS
ncbi:hypothetical protein [Nocardioides daphniae]|uniref:Uncharacterized protein n=1 Tax=Nocardioides daphniae TaxID=402297 RepID=A0A4P7U803_9ACTN|nr:hypothetical protein [Nocardioides daphniae]QCC76116.1 hypothetical protein E2C04_00925 [Nocardioides daphniae]GGD09974.1 hypothetical protein GCM10007231_06010 [Nocardioides daphniae]